MKFIVELPTYFRVDVDAPTRAAAVAAAEQLLADTEPSTVKRFDYVALVTRSEIVRVDGEDDAPDVMTCHEGELLFIESDGTLVEIVGTSPN